MSAPDRWLILRITAGQPLKAEDAVRALGIDAICPSEVVKRPHPFDRRVVIEYRRPILGGYCFVGEPFDVAAITTTRLKARLMAFENRYMQVADSELKALQERVDQSSRVLWRPEEDALVLALRQAMVGAFSGSYLTLGALQNMARAA